MKKVKTALTYSVFVFFLLCGTLFAGESIYPDDTKKNYDDRPEKSSGLIDNYTIQILNDSYGGNFYVYNDEFGNKHISNSMDIFRKRHPALITLEAGVRKDKVPSSLSDSYTVTAELADSDQYNDPESTVIEGKNLKGIPDPLETINRAFFQFNDRLYFWFLKPATKGYRAVVPEPVRIGVKNFFDNISFPIRFVNCLFQGKVNSAAEELRLFVANTTIGVGGVLNLSKTLQIKKYDEDLGQTFASYGMKDGFYINWPFLGPSSLRDSIGSFGDSFLDPMNYMIPRTKYNITTKGLETVNDTSFSLGDYEDLKKAALDPYISVRDAYFQYRQEKIKE